MASLQESPEYRAIQEHYTRLVVAVAQGNIPGALFEKYVIDDETLQAANFQNKTPKGKGETIMEKVQQTLRLDPPKVFKHVCDALSAEPSVEHLSHQLKATLKELKENADPPDTEEYQKLKAKLEAFSSTLESASSSNVELSTINCIKDVIQQYIEKALKLGDETSKVKSDMEKLCRSHLVIPTVLWTWTMQEVDKADEKLTIEQRKVVKSVVKEAEPAPSLFSKDTLYHACLCCDALSDPNPANPLSYFQNKNPHHSLKEVSFSQNRDSITPYLIAREGDVIYIAFQSTPLLSKWKEIAPSFDEGLMQQSSQIPLRFFMDELLKNRKIVFTGFSFGGMLASCVSARLWQNATADQAFLLQHVVCITFGQPFLQIKMVQDEIQICPQFEQSLHSIFYKDDVVPLMLSYLHVDESKLSNVPSPVPPSEAKVLMGPSDSVVGPRDPAQAKPGGLFNIPFVKEFLQNLAVLQYCSQAKEPSSTKAINWLKSALQSLAVLQEQNTCILYGHCYVMSTDKEKGITWQLQAKQLAAIELSQRTKLVADRLDERLFEKYSMESYKQLILRSYLEKPDRFVVPNRGQATAEVREVDALKPKVTGLQIHEYPPNDGIIILQGENLWFSYKICLEEKGLNHGEFSTPADNTTKFMIEVRVDSDKVTSALHASKQVKLVLYTHFANPIRQPINPKKEPHVFSVRQMQLAKHTPTQIIQLAYLCALLEQRDQNSDSKRFQAIVRFLHQAVKVVPIESIFDAITYERHDTALECAIALRERKLPLLSSQLMIMGALRASVRACTGYHRSIIDRLYVPSTHSLEQVIQAAYLWLHTIQQHPSYGKTLWPPQVQTIPAQFVFQPTIQEQSQPRRHQQAQSHGQPSSQAKLKSSSHQPSQKPPSSKKREVAKPKYSEVVLAGSASGSGEQFLQPRQQIHLVPQVMTVPFSIPVLLGQYPLSVPFPPYIIAYLTKCLKSLIEQKATQQFLRFGTELSVVGENNISEVYSLSERHRAHFKSPIQVLRNAMKEIATYTDTIEKSEQSGTNLPNEEMLQLINTIFNRDVAVCASLLGAFMEQQIRIPLLNTAKATAETLSSKAARVAVGVWALFSQNLGNLQAMLEKNKHNKLIVEIKEYIEGISQQLPENEDRMYAGKLQFLLQSIKEIVTASHQYISYSLEYQLCSNLKFSKEISLQELILEWDEIFESDALSLIARSHRPLVARWLKWTILIHDLRETLSQYTCIGVTGLINSGKSLLVKKLFGIEKVKVGTRAAKRTTVPLLYNLEESVNGLDVIDFPGVDDSGHTVPELADLLLSLAQIIVFVVDYRKANSDPVKQWLQALTKNGVPVLTCLTHADVLYAECAEEGKREDIGRELQVIRDHLKLDARHSCEVYFYSFKQTPEAQTSTEDLKKFGIKSPADVGDWLVQVLRTKFKQDELADKLKGFIQTDKKC
jgi:GTP-binding protein EngB required for normal cell division